MEINDSFFDRNNMNSIRESLLDLSFHDLIFHTELILDSLNPSDRIQYHVSNFCTDYLDRHGRIDFIEAVLKAGLIPLSQLPFIEQPETQKKSHQLRGNFFHATVTKTAEKVQKALTDDLEQATTSEAIELSNPRWEHVDEKRKDASPDEVLAGEKVKLSIEVKGIPEGATVSFDIYDASSGTTMRIDTVQGKCTKGKATAEWEVQDANSEGGKLKLEFEANAKSKASSKAKIDVSHLEFEYSD